MAIDYFLDLSGIKGGSSDRFHGGEIEVQSFSLGAQSNRSKGGGQVQGKTTVSDLSFTKEPDRATAPLLFACATGKWLDKGKLTCRQGTVTPVDYLIYRFTKVHITSLVVEQIGSTTVENVTLFFEKLEIEYQHIRKDGFVTPAGSFGWDLVNNVKI
jgi:type VI secretion system secreted protein Hcp